MWNLYDLDYDSISIILENISVESNLNSPLNFATHPSINTYDLLGILFIIESIL